MTSDMMFYGEAVNNEEKKIRQEGLIRLRQKVYRKMQRYQQPHLWDEGIISYPQL